MIHDAEIVAAGDSTLVIRFDERINAAINARAVALADAIRSARPQGLRDVVTAYRSVAVCFDPLACDAAELQATLSTLIFQAPDLAAAVMTRTIEVPVQYGGELGPDLSEVARVAGLSEREVIGLHTATTYRVYMMGFVPGFAYLGVVDARIAAPRKATPRPRVPPGSVAIAGNQTGIYPMATPGGWQIIGRTSLLPFDLSRDPACLFKPGDSVRFVAADI